MAKRQGEGEGDGEGGDTGSRACKLALLSLGLALLAVAGLAVCVMCLDARQRQRVQELEHNLDMLRQLVASMQQRMDRHESQINTTLQIKSTVKSETAEEVVYDEYEYDDNEDSYEEYDEEEEQGTKTTVKRTVILGANSLNRNSTELLDHTTHGHSHTGRTRRDVRSQAVPVREERIHEPLENSYEQGNERKPSQRRIHQQHPTSFYQEQKRPGETVVRLRHGGRSRKENIEDVELIPKNTEEEFELPNKPKEYQCNILAAHFVGDASNYNSGDHSHYYGNNILYHPHGLFKDWVPSNWMIELEMHTQFPIHDGKISIQKSGVYFVYAQIYYAATHDRCGFHIKRNGEEVAQCMSMTSGRIVKRNTCFTAVIMHLHKSDLLWVSEVEGFRNTSFKKSHSFFGLIQLKST